MRAAPAPAVPPDGSPLWVGGLVVASLFLGWRVAGFADEARDWATYAALGVVVPLGVLVIAGLPRRTTLERAVGAIGVAVAATLLYPRLTAAVTAASVLTWLVWEACGHRLARPRATTLLAITLAWCALSAAAYWEAPDFLLSGGVYHAAVATGAVVLVAGGLTAGVGRPAASLATLIAAGVLFTMSSVRASPLQYVPVMHHWGAIVGPAAAVRQGGWLLWDVPSQYGFLATLAIAAIPVASVWQAFYLLNAALQLVAAGIVFLLLRGARPSVVRDLFAMALTEAAVFLVPGFVPEVTGPWYAPSVGAFRFIWCYVLLAHLMGVRRAAARGRGFEAALAAGCVAWVLAALWSFESAAYASFIWLPAFAGLVLHRFRGAPGRVACWLALPAALVVVAGLAVAGCYRVALGHGPDWWGYVDYAAAFGGGFNALPANAGGPVAFIVLALWVIASIAARVVAARGAAADLAVVWGAWAALFSGASYYVLRSADSNATSLIPVACAAVGAAASTVDVADRRRGLTVLDAALVPTFATMLMLALAVPARVARAAAEIRRGFVASADDLLPDHPLLRQIVSDAGLTTTDRIAFLDASPTGNALPPVMLASPDGPVRVTMARLWLPTTLTLLLPLPQDRALEYVKRSEARNGGGWLIEPSAGPGKRVFGWLVCQLESTYRRGPTLANARWRITRFDPIAEPPAGPEHVGP